MASENDRFSFRGREIFKLAITSGIELFQGLCSSSPEKLSKKTILMMKTRRRKMARKLKKRKMIPTSIPLKSKASKNVNNNNKKSFREIIFIMNFSRENERRDLQLSTCVGPKLSAFFK